MIVNIYLSLFISFLKIGLFSFGGGYGMIPLLKEEVLNNGWLTEAELLDMIGVSESTPGPIAVNMATFVGASQAGILGSLIATFSVILPAFVIMLVIVTLLKHFSDNKYVAAALSGVRQVVIGLIISVGVLLFIDLIFGDISAREFAFDYRALIIAVILSAAMAVSKFVFKKQIPPILLIVISACLGMGIYAF